MDAAILAAGGLALRPAGEDDAAFERALFESARPDAALLAAWPADLRRPFLDRQFQFQTLHYARSYPHAARNIVEAGGRPVGRFILARGAAEWCVVDLALVPAARGRGFGGTLLRATQAAAARARVPVVLTVDVGNPARRLYQRLGFAVTREVPPAAGMAWYPP